MSSTVKGFIVFSSSKQLEMLSWITRGNQIGAVWFQFWSFFLWKCQMIILLLIVNFCFQPEVCSYWFLSSSCCPDAAQGFCDELEEAVRAQLGIDIWTGAGI
jgi:hypothetical protein